MWLIKIFLVFHMRNFFYAIHIDRYLKKKERDNFCMLWESEMTKYYYVKLFFLIHDKQIKKLYIKKLKRMP